MTIEPTLDEDFVEPAAGTIAGRGHFEREKSPYDLYMDEQGVPIYREIGVHDVREIPLGDWPAIGGRGAFLQLLGTENLWGMLVVEIPPGGNLSEQKHIYDAFYFVVEGRGVAEVRPDPTAAASFEWHENSLFTVPRNGTYRLVNVTMRPALLLVATTAPPVMNLFPERDFVFHNDVLRHRPDRGDGYYTFRERLLASPTQGRAMLRTNLVPDVKALRLPLDNQRSHGYRRVEAVMGGSPFFIFIGEHAIGEYSMAHYHAPSPILVCVKGRGYTYTWPRDSGPRPWEAGLGHTVRRQDYIPGGMVAAAPGGSDFFHQHFGVGPEPLRFLVFGGLVRWGTFEPGVKPGEQATSTNMDIKDGGASIGYADEDAHIRAQFEAELRKYGSPIVSDVDATAGK